MYTLEWVMRNTFVRFSLWRFWPALALLAMPMTAQWVNYPTPGTPRTKTGAANLCAPGYAKPAMPR